MINNIDNNKKVDILLSALDERYQAIHTIRERVQVVSLWILGILLATSSWLFQSNIELNNKQKIIYTIFSLIIWGILKYMYFSDLEKGFNGQQTILAKIEDSLGFYKKSYFNDLDDSIYPKKWKLSGQKGSEGNFFKNTYNLIAVGFGILIFSIILF